MQDKWKIRPFFSAREEYKNVASQFVEKGYTPAHREATGLVMSSFMEQMVAGIAEQRALTKTQARSRLPGGEQNGMGQGRAT